MASLPHKNEEYRFKEYWNQRYSQEGEGASFDWFKSYGEISAILKDIIPDKSARILMLGCGNSKLTEEMYDDGYKNIVNIDYSQVIIDRMKQRHREVRPELEWIEMDIRDLRFPSESFDVAIDKGTMDAMMTSRGDVWNPPAQVVEDCQREVEEVLRVLKKHEGVFIYLTFGQPHFRRRYLTRPDTTLEIMELGDTFHYYLYILRT